MLSPSPRDVEERQPLPGALELMVLRCAAFEVTQGAATETARHQWRPAARTGGEIRNFVARPLLSGQASTFRGLQAGVVRSSVLETIPLPTPKCEILHHELQALSRRQSLIVRLSLWDFKALQKVGAFHIYLHSLDVRAGTEGGRGRSFPRLRDHGDQEAVSDQLAVGNRLCTSSLGIY